jgi:hypothetical protein
VSSRAGDILSKHRRIIVIIVAATAISMYLAPFDKLMGVNPAIAQPGGNSKYGGLQRAIDRINAAEQRAPPQAQPGLEHAKARLQQLQQDDPPRSSAQTANANDNSGGGSSDHVDKAKSKADDAKTKASSIRDSVRHSSTDKRTSSTTDNSDSGGGGSSDHVDKAKSKADDAKTKASSIRDSVRHSKSKD